MMRDLRLPVHTALETGDEKALAQEREAYRVRALEYLQQGVAKRKLENRAPKWHRKKALEWLLATEQQLTVCTGQGWVQFQQSPEETSPKHPRDWPTLSLGVDQGGDGWCAGYYLMYHRHVSAMMVKDLSHRLWNDCQLVFQKQA